jgi:hypothetical protein
VDAVTPEASHVVFDCRRSRRQRTSWRRLQPQARRPLPARLPAARQRLRSGSLQVGRLRCMESEGTPAMVGGLHGGVTFGLRPSHRLGCGTPRASKMLTGVVYRHAVSATPQPMRGSPLPLQAPRRPQLRLRVMRWRRRGMATSSLSRRLRPRRPSSRRYVCSLPEPVLCEGPDGVRRYTPLSAWSQCSTAFKLS